MSVYEIRDKNAIAHLFAGWDETMIWSCLQNCMGIAYADDVQSPQSAQILIAGFCFFAGKANEELMRNRRELSFVFIPQNSAWERAIQQVYGDQVVKRTRYATKKASTFDLSKLEAMTVSLSSPYELCMIDSALYHQIMASNWAVDLCGNFESCEDFLQNGLGVVVLKNGEIVSGASTYTYYNGGIEIEIDTREDERRKGLALACGAKLILECLKRGFYPSWDAHNPGSLTLAEKLGYCFDKEYAAYEFAKKRQGEQHSLSQNR